MFDELLTDRTLAGGTCIVAAMSGEWWQRLAAFALAEMVGAVLVYVGRRNIRTRQARVFGKWRIINRWLGESSTYEGPAAVSEGWQRVIFGLAFIVFGIVLVANDIWSG
ncbi:MAG: hypothetical protein C4547_16100 [Phycisphaerales bacterium]|nr:MAG: hypothetical protein C4547_16100 [Phycisphaerales bacterium]